MRRVAGGLSLLGAVLVLALTGAPAAITVRLSARYAHAPAEIRAEVHIPRHPDNRAACLTLEGPYREEGCWPMAGMAAPPLFSRVWRNLPAGEYLSRARLQRADASVRDSNLVNLTVIGG